MFQNKPLPQIFGNKDKPDDSAQVEVVSTTKGFLGPRMTTVQRLAVPSPAEGLEVYDTDEKQNYIFDGTTWVSGGVKGPATSTDNAIPRWDGTGGNQLQDSNVIVDDVDAMSGITQLDVDNIRLDGNEISSTDTDGDITLNPNGVGKVVIAKDLQVLGTTTTVDSDTLEVADANVLVNKGGNQASANTEGAGLTVDMTDATNATFSYDSSLASKFKLGESGTESEVITADDTQDMVNKRISNAGSIPASLSFDQQSVTLASKPWPTMTTAERTALTTIQGAVIYNTTDNELQIFDGSDWLSYNIGVYFMIENGYSRDFATSNLGTTFEAIKTITGGTLKAFNVTNNSGNTLLIRVNTGVQLLVAPGDTTQIGYRGVSGDVVEIATETGTAIEGNIYINFLGV